MRGSESTPLLADEPSRSDRSHKLSEERAAAKEKVVSRWSPGDWLRGTYAGQITCILCVVAILQILGAVVWRLLGGNGHYSTSWEASFWFAWGMYFDPGTQMGLAADERHWIKALAAFFSVIGFLCNLLTLGFFVDLMRTTLHRLYKDGHRVVENGHILLLGWSERTVFLLAELRSASLNRVNQNSKIVILADVDEGYMGKCIDYSFTGIFWRETITVFRGSPHQVRDLMKVSAPSASQIINLGSTVVESQNSDRDALQAVVALASLFDEPCGNIINTVRCEDTIPVIDNIFRRAEGILARETVLRIMCVRALQPAIGDIFQTIATYRYGEELYCMSLSEMGLSLHSHKTFGDVCFALKKGICIGIKREGAKAWELDIAPPDSHRIGEKDKFVVVADREADIAKQDGHAPSPAASKVPIRVVDQVPRRGAEAQPIIIIVGWSADIEDTIEILDQYLPPESKLHILAKESQEAREKQLESMDTRNIDAASMTHHIGSPACVEDLKQLPLLEATAIFVLAEGAHQAKPTGSDSRCLASTISIRSLLMEDGAVIADRLFCEVLSPRTFRMLEKNSHIKECGNFFHSNAVETGLIAMASANRAVYNAIVFLLQPAMITRFVLVPVREYLSFSHIERQDGDGVLFWDLWRCARRRNELLLGWKIGQDLFLNPHDRDRPVQLSGDDSLIAIQCSA